MKQFYLLLMALLMSLSANAEKSGTCGDSLKWHLTDDGTLTISGKGKMTNYRVKSDEMVYYSRYSTAPWFYHGSNIYRVIIGDSVTSIGDFAFYKCKEIKSVTVPNNVKSIGKGAFLTCDKLTSLTIGNTVNSIGHKAIGYKISPYGGRGSRYYNIEEDEYEKAFVPKIIWLCNTPPSGYEDTEAYVNYVANDLYTGLSNKTVYPYLSSIFEVGGIKYVPVSPSNRTCDAIDCIYTGEPYNVEINDNVNYKGIDLTVKAVNPYIGYKCTNIKKVDFSLDADIAYEAFYSCDSLKSVTITKANDIGSSAFYNCDNLSSVTIAKANDIGSSAFYNCDNLSSVTIAKANDIGSSAFRKCYSLTELSLDSKIKSLGESAFYNCSKLQQFIIPDSVTTLNESLLFGCSSLESIKIHKGVKDIKNYVFYGCTNLSTVIIEDRDTLLNLGSNYSNPLFSDCKLDSVYIGGKIVYSTSGSYGYSPFYRNTSLRSVKISDVETTIYDNEFYGCTNLQNMSIGDSVKSIGNWAFSGCSSLNHFAFGSGLQRIGQEAFSDCNNVTEISSEALVPPTCGTNALDDINKWTCKLIVPKASMEAYKQAEQWKEFFFIEENTTGIQAMTSDTEPRSDVYSLTGAKVLDNASLQDVQSLPKGIYVIKGKKIIIK